tara:strand:+ start:2493 stop:3536 length:1044 start_codon:yes stop_codon:yes gene_type:complete
MARNQRIFYACQAVAIVRTGDTSIDAAKQIVKGLQSVGMSSTFTLDQVFEMGQIEIYENVEQVADIEVTLEKVIDGEALIYTLATIDNAGTAASCRTDLVAASKEKCDVYVAIYDDGLSHATGTPRNVCMNSGMYVSSVSYSYSVDGSATESVTLAGNDRFWNTTTAGVIGTSPATNYGSPSTGFNGADSAASGVVRKVNVDLSASTLPAVVKSQGGDISTADNNFHVQSITVSTDFGQENIEELGRFGPYARYATFPIEVTAEFEVIATSGDLIDVSGTAPNLSDNDIVIKDTAGTVLNLGSGGAGKNKLTSVSYSGGDTGGGNATVTYSFSNFNVLTVHDSFDLS